jgi:hypothetical protein
LTSSEFPAKLNSDGSFNGRRSENRETANLLTKETKMASATINTPKRVEPEVIQTTTFSDREAAKKALGPEPEAVKGFNWEMGVCSQEIEIEGVAKSFVRAYYKPVVTSIDGVLALAESDPIGLIKDLNYGSGLYYNSLVRQQIADENSGPAESAKTFEKQVAAFMKQRATLGKPVTEEKARMLIKAMNESD